MPTKQVLELRPKSDRGFPTRILLVLGAVVIAAFMTLLLVGFENVLALLRYRVTLFLLLGPLVLLFAWCTWRALRPRA